jgi:phage gpG-like protein
MPATINVSVDDSQVRFMIQSYVRGLPPLIRDWLDENVSGIMRDSFDRNFQQEGRPAWEQLAPSTVKKRGSAHPILQVTGDLRSEVTEESHSGHFKQVTQDNGGFALEMGATSGKYKRHQKGGFGSFGQFIPKRRMVVIQDRDVQDIIESLDNLIATFRR